MCDDNCLATFNPRLAKEWHPTKNGELTPKDVMPNTHQKVWWICKRKHEWPATVNSRTGGTGCPFCNTSASRLELRIFAEFKFLFGNVIHRKKIGGYECDIYIPRHKIGIDGFYWHKDKIDHDKKKTIFFEKKDISLLRLRENGLEKIAHNDIFYSKNEADSKVLKKILNGIIKLGHLPSNRKISLLKYLNNGKIVNDDLYLDLLYKLPSPLPGYSLCDVNNFLAKEWHSTKNVNLTPKDVTPNTKQKVWWICKRKHEWQAAVSDRNNGNGCPYCSGKSVCDDNCLETINPELSREWHPTKNRELTPRDVTAHSGKKVWWLCKNKHEWQAPVSGRTRGYGCPYCSGRYACDDNCLATLNSKLAKEWHPTKNGELTPKDVMPGSAKKVWWLCKNKHAWQTSIVIRTNGSGCPYCGGNYACEDNCLATINPKLAKEWHPTKNGDLTPKEVMPGSSKKVWWLCKDKHEWAATVNDRNNGSGCPYCSGRKNIK